MKKRTTTDPAGEAAVAVLLLVDCHHGKCGEVVTLGKAEAALAKAGGLVDDNPAAVNSGKD